MNKVRAVVFDWAGTTVDYGCRAPLTAFQRIFANSGLVLTAQEVAAPMGTLKIDHIRSLLALERVRRQFVEKFRVPPAEAHVHRLNDEFERELFALLPHYSQPIPGVLDTVDALRKNDIHVGSTTGKNLTT